MASWDDEHEKVPEEKPEIVISPEVAAEPAQHAGPAMPIDGPTLPVTRERLLAAQRADPTVAKCFECLSRGEGSKGEKSEKNATSKERSSIQCAGCDCCHPKRRKWVRTGISGMICDFDVYQGSVNGIRAKSELELSGDVVMKLASTLPEGQNYKIYADNYFTCVPLVVKLLDHGIHYVGTARKVRLPNCNLEDEKSLKPMKSRRWYVYIFWHTIILAVINAWLLYKREGKALKMPKQEILTRRQFQSDLASSLILVNTTPLKTPKRGRPSSGNGSPAATVTSRSPLNAQKRPSSGGFDCNANTTDKLINVVERLTLKVDNLKTEVKDLRAHSRGAENGRGSSALTWIVSRTNWGRECTGVPATVTVAGLVADLPPGIPTGTTTAWAVLLSADRRMVSVPGNGLHVTRDTSVTSHRVDQAAMSRKDHTALGNVSQGVE
ncbi:hypothetical protein F7725_009501 [Dissostichus mawsoni]|uniref:PiggyBac transposable element-derived protein domain-containing protein n=1 Tax=Dissostichus mawsoni TaxID=36200 RepID=A0A7J5XLK4_DISMA|nr:hypothetical protein F7725_009501 [Dissostichus mawsoni]